MLYTNLVLHDKVGVFLHKCSVAATNMTISGVEVKEEGNTPVIKWQSPVFPPYLYKFQVTCTYACAHSPYLAKEMSQGPSHTRFKVRDVAPGSLCVLKLWALYNPASLDEGLTIHFRTKAAS